MDIFAFLGGLALFLFGLYQIRTAMETFMKEDDSRNGSDDCTGNRTYDADAEQYGSDSGDSWYGGERSA